MKTYLKLFWAFFKIGCFTFGGGYAMIVMIRREVAEKNNWVNDEEFLNYLSLAQSSPGPMAVNTAILIGYKEQGVAGGICGFLGSVLPSFIILLIIAIFFSTIHHLPETVAVFKGIRPAVVALILYPVIAFAKNVTAWEYPLFIAIAMAIFFGLSPVWPIIGAIIAGALFAHKRIKGIKIEK